ncbi:hypothetical protein GCM10019016_079160 [Streptomyces prasinosporus]|uniref:Uncharacterized protein n=1 Tax=Streptomyces prasinosporus TaxID=68256 RepID=A0ABP6U289_9ACTN
MRTEAIGMSTETVSGKGPATAEATDSRLLKAHGIEKAYPGGMWPLRHHVPVLRGAGLTLPPMRWSAWSARTAPARAP